MRYAAFIGYLLLKLLFVYHVSAAAVGRWLPCEVAAIDTTGIMTAKIWDFSRSRIITRDSRMLCEVHGDTLISESCPGMQEWFRHFGDSLTYLGGEDRSRISAPGIPSSIFGFPLRAGACTISPYMGVGRVYSRYPYCEAGELESRIGSTGDLVTADGDSLFSVTVTRQTKDVRMGVNVRASEISCIPADSLPRRSTVTYRWYAGGDTLPVAIMRMDRMYRPGDKEPYCSGRAFLPDGTDPSLPAICRTRPAASDTAAIARAISDATVRCDGSLVTVSIRIPDGMIASICADVVDFAGNLYVHRTYECAGESSFSVSAAGLSPGDYLLVLASAEAPYATEKRRIKIR